MNLEHYTFVGVRCIFSFFFYFEVENMAKIAIF